LDRLDFRQALAADGLLVFEFRMRTATLSEATKEPGVSTQAAARAISGEGATWIWALWAAPLFPDGQAHVPI